MIGIVDYGAGNLLSVKKALEYLGTQYKVVESKKDFRGIDGLILPGVGAFRSAILRLVFSGMYEHIDDWIRADRPFLGICLGMQLLFETSEEAEDTRGFGIFRGNVVEFERYKVPQIGWNNVSIKRNSPLMEGIDDSSFFYFLHGYYVRTEESIVIGTTEYGVSYPSVIGKGKIYAVQFHPEKSGKIGLNLLKNWVRQC